MQALSGSPRLLRNLNEKAVLQHLLAQGALTRAELEAFTGLSKAAMSDLLKRLEKAAFIRREGEKAGAYGPKAGLWALDPRAGFVAGVAVSAHSIEVAIADLSGAVVAEFAQPRRPGEKQWAGDALHAVLGRATQAAGLDVSALDQVVVGLPGIVDAEAGHFRKGQQIPDWQGFDVPAALIDVLGHKRVLVENDVNLVTIEEATRGAGIGVGAMILLWIDEGIGGGLVMGGRLVRGSTGSVGEIGGALIPDWPGGGVTPATAEALLSSQALTTLLRQFGCPGADVAAEIEMVMRDLDTYGDLVEVLAYRIAAVLSGIIGMLDPDMVVLAGKVGIAGGTALAQRVKAILSTLPLAIPKIVPSMVGRHAVRAGAIELALEQSRERVFTGGSAARGLP